MHFPLVTVFVGVYSGSGGLGGRAGVSCKAHHLLQDVVRHWSSSVEMLRRVTGEGHPLERFGIAVGSGERGHCCCRR